MDLKFFLEDLLVDPSILSPASPSGHDSKHVSRVRPNMSRDYLLYLEDTDLQVRIKDATAKINVY